ncbi:hypothetical protein [Cellulomonas sp. URHB0016]
MRLKLGVIGVAVALTLGACTSGADPAQPSQSYGIAPTGEAEVVVPLESIDGATPRSVLGATVDVPSDLEASTSAVGEGGRMALVVKDPAQERALVTLTVSPEPGVTDEGVDVAARVAMTQLGITEGWGDAELTPATWEGFPHAAAMTAVLTLPDGTRHDVLLITLRDESSTKLINVSAEAPTGALEDSVAYDILRTLRLED